MTTCGYDDCDELVVERYDEPFFQWYDGLDSDNNPENWVGCECADGHEFNLKVS